MWIEFKGDELLNLDNIVRIEKGSKRIVFHYWEDDDVLYYETEEECKLNYEKYKRLLEVKE